MQIAVELAVYQMSNLPGELRVEGCARLTVRMMESASSMAMGRTSAKALTLAVHDLYCASVIWIPS